eukprot:g4681.t1
MGASLSNARARRRIVARHAREARQAVAAGGEVDMEKLSALKEWVEGDLNRRIASQRAVQLRGRRMRREVHRLKRVYLDTGADVNEVDPDRKVCTSCLMHAAMGGHLPIVSLLLEHGANPAAQNLLRESALSIAAAKNHGEVALRLLEHADCPINTVDVDGISPLSWAVIHNNVPVARRLLERGASMFQHRDKRKPLEIAEAEARAAAGAASKRRNKGGGAHPRDSTTHAPAGASTTSDNATGAAALEGDAARWRPMLSLLRQHHTREGAERDKRRWAREDKMRKIELEYWAQKDAERKRKGGAGPRKKRGRRGGRVVPGAAKGGGGSDGGGGDVYD